MTKTNLIIAGLSGCLFVVSCEPLPVGPDPRYGSNRYPQGEQRPDTRPYPAPDGRYDGGRYDDGRYDGGRYGDEREMQPRLQPAPQPTRDQYPTAERTDDPNRVLSPYAPYNVIDVEDFRSGQLAKDPSNGKIFRVP